MLYTSVDLALDTMLKTEQLATSHNIIAYDKIAYGKVAFVMLSQLAIATNEISFSMTVI